MSHLGASTNLAGAQAMLETETVVSKNYIEIVRLSGDSTTTQAIPSRGATGNITASTLEVGQQYTIPEYVKIQMQWLPDATVDSELLVNDVGYKKTCDGHPLPEIEGEKGVCQPITIKAGTGAIVELIITYCISN